MDEKIKQQILVEKILLASSLIEANRKSGGNMLLSNKWVIDHILGSRNISRKYKIKKILDDKAREV